MKNKLINAFFAIIWIIGFSFSYLEFADTDPSYISSFAVKYENPMVINITAHPTIISYNIEFLRSCKIHFERWIINDFDEEKFLLSTRDLIITPDMLNKPLKETIFIDVSKYIPGKYTFQPIRYISCNIVQDYFPIKEMGKELKFTLDTERQH